MKGLTIIKRSTVHGTGADVRSDVIRYTSDGGYFIFRRGGQKLRKERERKRHRWHRNDNVDIAVKGTNRRGRKREKEKEQRDESIKRWKTSAPLAGGGPWRTGRYIHISRSRNRELTPIGNLFSLRCPLRTLCADICTVSRELGRTWLASLLILLCVLVASSCAPPRHRVRRFDENCLVRRGSARWDLRARMTSDVCIAVVPSVSIFSSSPLSRDSFAPFFPPKRTSLLSKPVQSVGESKHRRGVRQLLHLQLLSVVRDFFPWTATHWGMVPRDISRERRR